MAQRVCWLNTDLVAPWGDVVAQWGDMWWLNGGGGVAHWGDVVAQWVPICCGSVGMCRLSRGKCGLREVGVAPGGCGG